MSKYNEENFEPFINIVNNPSKKIHIMIQD